MDRDYTRTLRMCSLRSPRSPFLWLVDKEWRELIVSRAWWGLLFGIGPLVGVSFISAVRTYAEVSGMNGTSAGVGEALSPLIGVWAPTYYWTLCGKPPLGKVLCRRSATGRITV